MVKEKIIDFLKKNGPSLPVEINKAIGYDTFLTQALLTELIDEGLVRKSKRPIGNSLIYYMKDDADKMREKIYSDLNIPEKKVLQKLREVGRITSQALEPHERAFIERLQDFLKLEKTPTGYIVNYYNYQPSPEQMRQTIEQYIPKPELPKINIPLSTPSNQVPIMQKPPEIKPVEVKQPEIKPAETQQAIIETEKPEIKKTPDLFERKARKYLDEIGEVTNSVKIKTGQEYNYDLRIKKPFTQELLIKAKNKKSINETDLSMLYAEALSNKKPAILLTNGKLTSKAKQWKDANAGELIRIIEL